MNAKLFVLFTLPFFFICLSPVMAQQQKEGVLSGNLVDSKTSHPIESATVRVLTLPDSTFVGGAVTDSLGNFRVRDLALGRYVMVTNMLGYAAEKRTFTLTKEAPAVRIDDMEIVATDILLGDGVVVSANAVQMTVREDTIIYNADAFRVQEGAMLEDLIKKLPGVEVAEDGTITVNGQNLDKILFDGKEFFSNDPKVALKNLPANMADKVKSYNKKSDFTRTTGIEDGNEEVVLDIQVKPGMKDGWVGNIFGGYGNKERYEAALNANRFRDDSHFSLIANSNNTNNQGYSEMGDGGRGRQGNSGSGVTDSKSVGTSFAKDFTENLKLGGDFRYGHSNNDAYTKNRRETHYNDSTSVYEAGENASNRIRDDFNFNFRVEWKPDTLTTLIFRPNISTSKTRSNGRSETETSNDTARVNDNWSSSDSEYTNLNVGGSLNLIRRLNSKGRNFSFNVDYGYGKSTSEEYENSNLIYYLQPEQSQDYKRFTDGESRSNNLSVGASYSEPLFNNKTFLQLTYNFSYRNTKSNRYGYEQDAGDNIDWAYFTPAHADTTLSSCYENTYITHRIGIGMRHFNDKYNLSYGINLNPQSSKTNNIFGPNMNRGLKTQNVVNWSPNVDYRYRFTRQSHLRFEYRGRSNAPDIDQLQEVISMTNPQHIRYGNPTLKPSFSHNIIASYNGFNVETRRSIVVRGAFSTTQNTTTNMTLYDPVTGIRISKLMNVNGNWNANGMFGFNTPLDSKNRFNVNSYSRFSYSENVSFNTINMSDVDFEEITSEDMNQYINAADKNVTHNLRLSERLSGSYRIDWFEITINGNVSYNKINSDEGQNNNRETFDYRTGGSTNVTLPWNIYVSTDCNYTHRKGYSAGLKNNEVMWNAQISKSFLRNNAATIRFKIYDILKEQSNVNRTIDALTIADTETNTLGSYFMFNFVLKFNTLGRGSTRGQGRGGMRGMDRGGERMGPPSNFGPGGPGGGGGFGGPMM